MFAHGRLLSAAVIAASAGTALAANELQIDVNSLTTQVMPAVVESGDMYDAQSDVFGSGVSRGGGFGTTFTGSIAMSDDATSVLAGILGA